jgi:type IV pilus assembly protein PilW
MRYPVRQGERGMSLVEILVGVLIGLIGIVVIFQVLSVSENRKRTTVQGSDAQSAGAIALYTLQRDVQLGGYGFGSADTKQIGCLVQASDKGDTTPVPPIPPRPNFTFRLYPVEIAQGAGGASDTIRVLWGNSNQVVTFRDWTPGTGASSETVPMKEMKGGRAGLDYGDILILTAAPSATPGPETACVMVQVTDRPTAFPKEVGFDSDYTLNAGETKHAAATPTPRFNKDVAWPASVFKNADGSQVTAGFMFNLGKQPRRLEWRVTPPTDATPNRLMMSETLFGGIAPVEASDGMINLQAEYGIDQNNNDLIDALEWTEKPPDNSTIVGDPNKPCSDSPSKSWRCVRAVRVALLARSAHWDQTFCSPNPQWSSGVDASGNNSVPLALKNFVMTNVDGTAPSPADDACTETPPSPNNWRRYRYSVYETVIPLRNMIWGTAP